MSAVLVAVGAFLLWGLMLGWRPLWFKITFIKWLIRSEVRKVATETFWIHWYGAYSVDPKHLVYWICVQTDKERDRLITDNALHVRLRAVLDRVNYPASARGHVHMGFECQETVDRESGGSWQLHWK